ncbi:MAG: fasciclin domain-containing protein [Caulobacter sp.]|nr:fasciclin domain-containing protein [Caulobacter sp.]
MQAFRFAAVLSTAALFAAPAFAEVAGSAPAAPAPMAAPAAPAATPVVPSGDMIETLRASGQFTTLLRALSITKLTGVIQGQKTLTLFAPTDAAFAALPAGELDRLLKDAPALQAVLVYHLVNAPVDSTKIAGARGPVATVAGSGLLLDGANGGLMANDAHIVQADIRTPNGIIHVVDKVLSADVGAAMTARAAADAAATQAGAVPAT